MEDKEEPRRVAVAVIEGSGDVREGERRGEEF